MSSKAVFLDRDGTLMQEVHYCSDPARVRIFTGAGDALMRLSAAGFLCILITNQSGIGRGIISLEQYRAVHAELLRQLSPARLADSFYCAATPDMDDPRRKPSPGMVLEAAAKHRIDLSQSWFVGDKDIDVKCGRTAGTRTILVRTGYGKEALCATPDFHAKDIVEAAEIILTHPA